MKRICTLILFIALVITFPLIAGDVPADLKTTFEFRTTTTWGCNFDTFNTGFETVINWLSLSFTPTGWKTLETPTPSDPLKPYFYFTITGLDLKIINISHDYGTQAPEDIRYNYFNYVNISSKLVIDPFWIGIIMQGDPKANIWPYDAFIGDYAYIGSRTMYRALQDGGMGTYNKDSVVGPNLAYWKEKYRDLFQAYYYMIESDDPDKIEKALGRIIIGYDNDIISLVGKVGSRFSWVENEYNEYAFGMDAHIRPFKGMHIDASAYGTTYKDPTGNPIYSAKLAYDIPLFYTIYLQPFVGFDTQITVDGPNIECVSGISMPWPGGGYQEDPIYILDNGKPGIKYANVGETSINHRYTKNDTFGGLTLGAAWYRAVNGEVRTLVDLSIFEKPGDAGLFKEMGLVVSGQLYNLTRTPEYGIAIYWDYEIFHDMFRVMAAGQYQNYDQDKYAAAVDNLDLQVGIHYIAIPGTTIGMEFETGNLFKLPGGSQTAIEPVIGNLYIFLSFLY